jgi:hypothetical protein
LIIETEELVKKRTNRPVAVGEWGLKLNSGGPGGIIASNGGESYILVLVQI